MSVYADLKAYFENNGFYTTFNSNFENETY